MEASFSLSATSSLIFGPTELFNLPRLVSSRGFAHLALVVSPSFQRSSAAATLLAKLQSQGIATTLFPVTGEPTVEQIDALSAAVASCKADAVVGIGGGSVLDTAKAVSVMAWQLTLHGEISVLRYLEGVGDLPPPSQRLPLIAIPTTA
ncbi:MAG: alcohol dehydrogenase, partial [Spirochaetae bacterium HGW-Spirochaetae-8]